jgi:hypothetical protein
MLAKNIAQKRIDKERQLHAWKKVERGNTRGRIKPETVKETKASEIKTYAGRKRQRGRYRKNR